MQDDVDVLFIFRLYACQVEALHAVKVFFIWEW